MDQGTHIETLLWHQQAQSVHASFSSCSQAADTGLTSQRSQDHMVVFFLKKEHFTMIFLMSLNFIKSGIVLGHSSAQSSVYMLFQRLHFSPRN